MESCMAIPIKEALLKKKHNYEMMFDPFEPEIDGSIFGRQYWSDIIYGE